MRLDKFLKVSRLIKRRTVANEACDNARISVNGRPAKASYDVKVGDKIEISMDVPLPWRFCRWRKASARMTPPPCTRRFEKRHRFSFPRRCLFSMD